MKELNENAANRVKPTSSPFERGLWVLTGGQVIQLVGDHSLTIAVSAFTYGMTGSAWAFALQQLVMYIPWLLFSAIAGPLADRLDQRKVMIAADVIRGLACLGYPFCRSLEPILILNFIGSTCRVFSMTARTALVPRLCDKDALLKANGIRTSVFGIIDLTVPALAGVLIAEAGAVSAFPFTTATATIGASLFTLIPPHLGRAPLGELRQGVSPRKPRTNNQASLRAAASFIKSDKALLALVLLYCGYCAGQHGANAVFYPFVDSVLHSGPAVFGLSVSLYFGSSFIAGLLLARYGKTLSRIPATAMAVPPMLVWLMYSVVRGIPVVLAMGFIEGLAMSILTNLLTTDVQSRAPSDMTGRVWGLTQTLTTASEISGVLVAGSMAERFGPLAAYRLLGTAGLITVTAIALAPRQSRSRV